ncbi:ABC transporter ATP-binding protein [Actinomyces glycerinitolerans]|uniref:Abc transporter n=1 Tax=Actinomyces glycerinitolerans TaxID=1892869 RepID=A0A1M4S213_9ACTO|nr:ABC transporter ATP-binding protein [Actinomyces glycerinitolerans]SHE26265.1 abc transporter [Actinomyces glycerinitolerans]
MELRARELAKDFSRGRSRRTFTAVRPVDLELEAGTLTVITGRSGSGKSTLLSMLAGMLTPTAGSVMVGEENLYALGEAERSRLRNRRIGLVPQGHTALRSLTVLENVLLPAVLYGRAEPPQQRAEELLEAVGLAELREARPSELSGGELRRMAVARALLLQPRIVLADEPTAGLDGENTVAALELLREAANAGAAVLVVTHESEADRFADRAFTMGGGSLSPQADQPS